GGGRPVSRAGCGWANGRRTLLHNHLPNRDRRAMKANSRFQTFLRELRLTREEREAARAERRAEAALRSEGASAAAAARRMAAIEAERRRATMHGGDGVGGM